MRRIRNLVGVLALGAMAACELATDLNYGKIPCENGRTLCDGQCWDLSASQMNCGACGNTCQYPAVCTNGACGCPSSMTDCGQGCTSVYSDSNNCGACGHACASQEYCNAGSCRQQQQCSGYAQTYCGGYCVDIASDWHNCGGCNAACLTGMTCQGGKCVLADAGTDGSCDAEAGAGVDIAGNLIVYGPLFSQTTPTAFAGKARITMQGAVCDWVETTYDASAPVDDAGKNYFHLGNVKPDTPAWAHIYQSAGGTEKVYPTLIPVNATADLSIDDGFGFVSSTELDAVYTASSVTRDPSKGTLLIQLLDAATKTPISGGSVTSILSGNTAYAASGSWSSAGPTDATGVVLVLNIDAAAFPGTSTAIHVVTSASSQDYVCQVEAGAATICWIGVGF